MSHHAADLVDLPALLRQLAALPVFGDTPNTVRRGIKLDVGRSATPGARGVAFCRERRLRLVIGAWSTAADVAEVMLHELVHLALPDSADHGERFRLTLARAAREAWGIVTDPHPAPAPWLTDAFGRPLNRPCQKIAAYVLDDNIRDALAPLIESGAVTLPAPPVPTRPTREAATEALIARRAEHAAKMLARAERRLLAARTIAKKWQGKVAYYERSAAKRGRS
jgi:hypothetical protein